MSNHLCAHCQEALPSVRRNPRQNYCNKSVCQKARKAAWQKNKMKTEPAYKENQERAQKDWQKNHPEYWKTYRENHPEYTERNRRDSQKRTQFRRQIASILTPFAKMDVKFLKVNILQGDHLQDLHVCKERTVSPVP